MKRIGSLRATYNLESKRPPRNDNSPYKFSEVKTNEVIYNRKLTYYLVPMWVMNIQHKNKKYTFAMNGQTGAMRVDKLPTTPLYGHIKPIVFLILLFLEIIFGLIVYKVRGVSFIDMLIPLTLSLLALSIFNYFIAGIVNDILLKKTAKSLMLSMSRIILKSMILLSERYIPISDKKQQEKVSYFLLLSCIMTQLFIQAWKQLQ